MSARHPDRRHRVAVAGAFFVQGLTFVGLTAKLPALQDRFHLTPSSFSLLMLALVLCAGVGSVLGEWIARRAGSAAALRLGFAASACMLGALALTHAIGSLALTMAGYGLGLGLVDAASNMQAASLEHRYGRTILPSFHAAWTCGGILGTLAALVSHGWSFGASACVLLVGPLCMVAAPYLRHGAPMVAEPSPVGDAARRPAPEARPVTDVPWRRIVLLGLSLVLFYMVDTAITTWAPTYLHRTFDSSGQIVAVATLPYLVGSLVSRGSGDRLTARFGAPALVRSVALVGCVGLAVAVFASNAPIALAGLALTGLALAVVAPLAYSTAAQLARQAHGGRDGAVTRAATDAVVARFNQFNYVGGLLGAVLTGALGDASLRYGFAVPMVLVLALVPLSSAFRVASA